METLLTGVGDAGKTLAAFLREHMPDLSWSKARELCATGRVRLDDDECLDAHVRLRAGQSVIVDPSARRRMRGVLHPADVIHLDEDVLVVNKRAGVLTVPFEPTDRDTLVDQARALLARIEKARRRARDPRGARDRGPPDVELGVVQRLDKDTTGVLVFPRRLSAKRALDTQIRAHSAERRYLALVHGDARDASYRTFLVQDRGDGLRGSWGTRPAHVGPPPADAKESVTHVRAIEHLRAATRAGPTSVTLVECRLETGRQHQIRIHLSEAGHPLVGERVYVRGFAGPVVEHPRPLLHAASLAFVHPRTGERVRFEAPLPRDFERVLAALRAERAPSG
ncbi:MAG: RluA family pseudouridine synthase [Sandaracinaceae bacterium]